MSQPTCQYASGTHDRLSRYIEYTKTVETIHNLIAMYVVLYIYVCMDIRQPFSFAPG